MHESNSTLSHLPRKRGRKPKPVLAELPKVRVSALQLWSLRECARVLAVSRERVQAAIAAGDLPAESSGQHSRRVLATDAVKALAPHLLDRLQLL
jgi:hypothetical protein